MSAVMRVRDFMRVTLKEGPAVRRMVPPRWTELWERGTVNACAGRMSSDGMDGPEASKRALELDACDLEVLEVGDDLGDLGQCGRVRHPLLDTVRDVL